MQLLDDVQNALIKDGFRVHGNGFIQIRLDRDRRLHIWPYPLVPCQETPSPIHDHRFGFTSQVLVGSLLDKRYTVASDKLGEYQVWTVGSRPDDPARAGEQLIPTSVYAFATPLSTSRYYRGTTYTMLPFIYHETVPLRFTITLMVKTLITPTEPRVLVPRGKSAGNAFSFDPASFRVWVDRALVELKDVRVSIYSLD